VLNDDALNLRDGCVHDRVHVVSCVGCGSVLLLAGATVAAGGGSSPSASCVLVVPSCVPPASVRPGPPRGG
jgi:hypothetical protein